MKNRRYHVLRSIDLHLIEGSIFGSSNLFRREDKFRITCFIWQTCTMALQVAIKRDCWWRKLLAGNKFEPINLASSLVQVYFNIPADILIAKGFFRQHSTDLDEMNREIWFVRNSSEILCCNWTANNLRWQIDESWTIVNQKNKKAFGLKDRMTNCKL